jgi:type I restriction enzyme R subunit
MEVFYQPWIAPGFGIYPSNLAQPIDRQAVGERPWMHAGCNPRRLTSSSMIALMDAIDDNMNVSMNSEYPDSSAKPSLLREQDIEYGFIGKLQGLKYDFRKDIRDRATLEKNFREKFEALNRVRLTDAEFARLLERSSPRRVRRRQDSARAQQLRARRRHAAELHAGQHQGLVQEQLRGHQPAPHQHRQQPPPLRRDPAHQRRARRADRAEDAGHQPAPGHGADRRLQERPRQRLHQDAALLPAALHRQQPHRHLVLRQQQRRHFSFNADERFLPIYQFADEDNKKITHLDSFAETPSSPNARWARPSAATWCWWPASRSC